MADNLQDFLDAAKSNSDLQAKLSEAPDMESVVSIAKEFGFELSVDALESLSKVSQLSDQELEAVAGGGLLSWVAVAACKVAEALSEDANSMKYKGTGCCK